MKELDEILESFVTYFEEKLPPLLTVKGEVDFQKYLSAPPTKVSEKQLAFYMGAGDFSKANQKEVILVQAQLPKCMNPIKYHTEISKLFRGMNVSKVVGYTDLEYEYRGWFPGDVKDGGSSSFLLYEVTLESELDDCDY